MKTASVPLSRVMGCDRPDEHPVALREGAVVSFRRFRNSVAATAQQLRDRGARRCGLVARDSVRFAIGLFGALHAGAKVVLPPNSQAGTLSLLAPAWDVLLTEDDQGPGSMTIVETDGAARVEEPLDPSVALLDFFTSGSSSQPKLIPRCLAELEAELAMVDRLWGARVSGCTQATVSHQHIYGLTFKLLWSLLAGRPFAAETHDIWESLLPAIEPGALLVSSPAHLSRLDGLPALQRGPGLILTAGAPLAFDAAEQTKRILGLLPDEIYGSTETGVIGTRIQDGPDQPWRAFPGCRIRQHEDGRLVLKSEWAGIRDWLIMDDLVALGGEDLFRLLGRSDRVVKIEGKRISLPAVEAALACLPQVAEAAVVALSGRRDQLGAALVLTELGRDQLARDGAFRFGRRLQRVLGDALEPMARPKRWRFVTVLPTGGMGKRSQAAIGALFED